MFIFTVSTYIIAELFNFCFIQKFCKDLFHEIDSCECDTEAIQCYEDIFVDVLQQWSLDVHKIEVSIVQLAQWLKNENNRGFKPKLHKLKKKLHDELFNISEVKHALRVPVKRLQSARTNSRRHGNIKSQTDSDNKNLSDKELYLTNVKVNRTMELRRAMTNKKRKEMGRDPIYATPIKAYKSLENYVEGNVYKRLTNTTTIACHNQQKGKTKHVPNTKSYIPVNFDGTISRTRCLSPKKTRDQINRGRSVIITTHSAKSRNNRFKNIVLKKNRIKDRTNPRYSESRNLNNKILSRIPIPVSWQSDKNYSRSNRKYKRRNVASPCTILPNTFHNYTSNDNFKDLKDSSNSAQKLYGEGKKRGAWLNFFRKKFTKKKKKEEKQYTETRLDIKTENILTNTKSDEILSKDKMAIKKNENTVKEKIGKTIDKDLCNISKNIFNRGSKNVLSKAQQKIKTNSKPKTKYEPEVQKDNVKAKMKGIDVSNSNTKVELNKKKSASKGKRKTVLSQLRIRTGSTTIPDKVTAEYNTVKNVNSQITMEQTQSTGDLVDTHNQIKDAGNISKIYKSKSEDTKRIKTSLNFISSQIPRKEIEVEELDVKPSSLHVFTKYSDDQEQNKLLIKLHQRYNKRKERVEDAGKIEFK